MTFKCPDCGAPLREGPSPLKGQWWCSGCGRFFGSKTEITLKRQEQLESLAKEHRDIGNYPHTGLATEMGFIFDEAQGRLDNLEFIEEYYRRGEYIEQLQATIYVTFAVALVFLLLWLFGVKL